MGYMNDTRGLLLTTCPSSIDHYVQNLTSSYSNKSNESSVVATSVFMLVLAAVFFNLNLFSRVSNTSAVLNPTARAVLNSALNLFLPVMSYLFSEAKNTPDGGADLPVRARLILTWMLLVELLRKKVEAILVTAGMQQGYSNIITHANAVAWLGYLAFFNLKVAGRVAVFGTLWLLCAAKFVQRVAFTEIGKRSLAYGKNARLLSSYMAEMVKDPRHGGTAVQDQDLSPLQRMKMCKYVVMGEENLMLKPGPHGYELDLDRLNTTYDDGDHIVTVGKIWELVEQEKKPRLKRLQRLSLSFALFKLLRPRFELLPAMTKQETDHCRDLIFQGLCRVSDGDVDPGVALFQVLKDEISFVSEYYHSVHPVVLASPYFFVINYITFPVVVLVLCFMTIALAGNGDMLLAFHSVGDDNYAISSGIFTLTKCLWKNFLRKPAAFFAIIDISITYLLFIAFVYEEVWEYMVFVFSNWFMVSLLCTYTARRRWQESKTYRGTLRRIAWISSKLSHPSRVTLKQFSVLRVSWLSMTLPTTSLPTQAKRSIMERFRSAAYGRDGFPAPLSNGRYVLYSMQRYSRLSWFCDTQSVAEVIITWHIATSLLEMTYPGHRKGGTSPTDHHRAVATKLSKYCSYLVVFHPELLPDDRECTERVYEDMKTGLKEALGSWNYHLGSENARYTKMMATNQDKLRSDCWDNTMTMVQKGIVLGNVLVVEANGDYGAVWKLLADLWVELIVYVAPSSGDEHVKWHEEALVLGGELITLLWALATHTGVTRPPSTSLVVMPVGEDVEEGVRPCV
ncbi:unnamed protein product [Triticum aestivum]|uniref:DUF4220 domain-containing protein n=2 Tax=Triticum aestivum TaxID=4565 RepID=A0A9R1N9Z9_WHEAT|nr:uncharacterized protein LOC123169060 [Triticum aestivum]KAF7106075.1 hypothetical protein CFC21_106839 [Triticum aestivum]SPT19196.1 unnamed protein product [Triticum aestivum]